MICTSMHFLPTPTPSLRELTHHTPPPHLKKNNNLFFFKKKNQQRQGSLRALALATAVATGVAAVGFGEAHTLDVTALHALAGIGFLGGFFAALTILSALDAAVAAVVVQGVVAPEGIKGNHPKEAKALEGVWAKEGLRLGPQERKTHRLEGGKKNKGGDVEAQA